MPHQQWQCDVPLCDRRREQSERGGGLYGLQEGAGTRVGPAGDRQTNVSAVADDSNGAATGFNGNAANAAATLEIHAINVTIGAGHISAFPGSSSGGASSVLNGLASGGAQNIAVLVAAAAFDGGSGSNHHANALAQANIDPPGLVQINGDVDVVAVAIDSSGAGASANANLLIQGSAVHIGTESGHGLSRHRAVTS